MQRMVMVGLLAWVLPGLGHLYLRQQARGMILLVMVALTFWTGVAVGGVRSTVDPKQRTLWFMAQISAGSHTLATLALREIAADPQPGPTQAGAWLSTDVGIHYTGVAGLLNVLVILDALLRCDPTIRRDVVADYEHGGTG